MWKSGHCWEAYCDSCDKVNGCAWVEEEPSDDPPVCAYCDGSMEWRYTFVPEIGPIGRMSGFSNSDSDFTPHYNTATGKYVRSLSEMKYLQSSHGLEDAVVKGKGERFIPRDWLTAPERNRREAEKHGIKVSFED